MVKKIKDIKEVFINYIDIIRNNINYAFFIIINF